MRYDREADRITVGVSELCAIARRGISSSSPEDEPRGRAVGKRARERLLGGGEPVRLESRFTALGQDFLLVGAADGLADGVLSLIRTLPHGGASRRAEEKQLRGEGFILAHMALLSGGGDRVLLRLITLDESGGEERVSEESVTRRRAEAFFDKCLSVVAKYAAPEVERVTDRLPSLASLAFPYDRVRDGQEELLAATYRAACHGTTLFACAPTGTGKTVSVLYPALRAMGEGKCDKVFYLTPKATAGQGAAECLELLASSGGRLRAVVLSAKESCCPRGLLCRDERRSCPTSHSGGSLPDAVLALYGLALPVVRRGDVARVAEEHGVCPYELELSYAELCDAVICDINYLFDPRVYLRRFFDRGGRYFLLIDEAHNLAERAREMYSAEITLGSYSALLEDPLISPVSKLRDTLPPILEGFRELLLPYLRESIYRTEDGSEVGADHESTIPVELYGLTEGLSEVLSEELRISEGAGDADASARRALLRDAYYTAESLRLATVSFDDSYRMFLFLEEGDLRIKLFAVGTAARIAERVALCRGAVFFSATLTPLEYYRAVLGGDRASEVLEAASPFAPEQLSVSIVDRISTRYQERERTAVAVVRAIAATIAPRKGNYMVFAPSYEYCELLSRAFSAKHPKIRTVTQRRDMTHREREELLSAFREDNEDYLVGFCTLGGSLSEGVDLAGDRLIGAVVVGIGMPSPSYEREAMTEYYEERFEAGKLYAYVYPGMNKVTQAAGRVIRRESDRGVITLIDDRFDDPVYKKHIPDLWRGLSYVGTARELRERITEFWRQVDAEH